MSNLDKAMLDKAMARLHAFRRRFEDVLQAEHKKSSVPRRGYPQSAAALREIADFGRNPGNLRMFVHVPDSLPAAAPLVVALHGCGQTAADYDQGSGWSSLATRLGFVALYPEQQPANNPKTCFSWFLPGDTARDRGEAASIRQMIEHVIVAYGIDRRRVFVTGLSAGGAMASVMLATYPDVFAGGAIIAGLPYGSARSAQQAFDVMFNERSTAPAVLGDRVRAASQHRGPWPKLSVWHGGADPIVKPSNAEDIIRQWSDVHGVPSTPAYEENIGAHRRRVWTDVDGNAVIEAFAIAGMGHGVPLAVTGDAESCGAAGSFFLETGISSTHRIAGFWQLDQGFAEEPRLAAAPASRRTPATPGKLVATAGGKRDEPHDAAVAPDVEQPERAYEPDVVIAAAFKAAGLQAPKPLGASSSGFDPSSIIQAALKAAGLMRT